MVDGKSWFKSNIKMVMEIFTNLLRRNDNSMVSRPIKSRYCIV